MAGDRIPYRFVLRGNTAAGAAASDIPLLEKEIAYETDTGRSKVGLPGDATKYRDVPLHFTPGFYKLDGLEDGQTFKWDQATGLMIPAPLGKEYQPGDGISIDSTDPQSPIISSTLGSIALSGRKPTYADLPAGLGSGNAGSAYYVESDGLVYIWSGTAFPASGAGVRTNGLVAIATLSAAATSISVSGLNLNRDLTYRMVASMKLAGSTAANVSLYFNADATNANYRRVISSTTLTSGNINTNGSAVDAIVAGINPSGATTVSGDICLDAKGSARTILSSARDIGADLQLQSVAHAWSGTSNVTSVRLTASVANSIGAGSFLAVYRI